MASDIIFTGHLPLMEIHAAATAADEGGGEEADDEKSYKTSPFSADDEDDEAGDHGSAMGRGSRRTASLPGTPRRPWESWRKYASEMELRNGLGRRRRRWNRERKLDRAWEMRKSRASFPDSLVGGGSGGEGGECLVLVRPRGGSGRRICMDMDEVKACRDLGLDIPRDFTVEIPGGISGNSSGADSPISGTGEDAKEIKAKLKMWAHAVAFVSSAARSGR
ncbi:hypothetical protein IEQ34_019093 [Dendrobium chrysotoxum]|uniref:Fold protein n=1 Tax=Dendrobium chrysotoxum TaxID=161865 RepID=A0AAV7G7I2_DENCH|nr:hypothetical protein IEQ34_019093 [Dendrobium chrysotoxum]